MSEQHSHRGKGIGAVMHFFTHGRALIIGVGDYQDPQWTVQITVADAECVADALTDPAVGAYPPEQVQVLTGAQTTRAGVTAALTQLAHEARVTDTVVIFFCGHGALGTDGVYHFAT